MWKHHTGTDRKKKGAVNKHREKGSQEPLQLKEMGGEGANYKYTAQKA